MAGGRGLALSLSKCSRSRRPSFEPPLRFHAGICEEAGTALAVFLRKNQFTLHGPAPRHAHHTGPPVCYIVCLAPSKKNYNNFIALSDCALELHTPDGTSLTKSK